MPETTLFMNFTFWLAGLEMLYPSRWRCPTKSWIWDSETLEEWVLTFSRVPQVGVMLGQQHTKAGVHRENGRKYQRLQERLRRENAA